MKFVAEVNGRNSEKNLPRLSFVHHETPHGVTETRTQDPSGGGGERLITCATELPLITDCH